VAQLVLDLAIVLKMHQEIPLQSPFKEEHPSLYNGLGTITPVDLSVSLGLLTTNPIATLLSMPESNNTAVTKWVVDLLIQATPLEEIPILLMVASILALLPSQFHLISPTASTHSNGHGTEEPFNWEITTVALIT
jgi:hypothetical protein